MDLFPHHTLAKPDLALFGCVDRGLTGDLQPFFYLLLAMVENLRPCV